MKLEKKTKPGNVITMTRRLKCFENPETITGHSAGHDTKKKGRKNERKKKGTKEERMKERTEEQKKKGRKEEREEGRKKEQKEGR